MIAQLLRGGVVVNVLQLPDGATIASDGSHASWGVGGAGFIAPPGCTLMAQAGACVGWILSGSTLVAPPTPAATLRADATAKLQALLAKPRSYALSGGPTVLADATTATGVDLQSLNVWGAANPAATTSWVDDLGGVTVITGAEAQALALAVLAYGQSAYAVLASAMTQIGNGAITTTDEIDALAWPT